MWAYGFDDMNSIRVGDLDIYVTNRQTYLLEVHSEERGVELLQVVHLAHAARNFDVAMTPTRFQIVYHVNLVVQIVGIILDIVRIRETPRNTGNDNLCTRSRRLSTVFDRRVFNS